MAELALFTVTRTWTDVLAESPADAISRSAGRSHDEVHVHREGHYVTATGRVLTDADIEALSAEAEAGYPIEKLWPVARDVSELVERFPSLSLNVAAALVAVVRQRGEAAFTQDGTLWRLFPSKIAGSKTIWARPDSPDRLPLVEFTGEGI